eukprot:jgi/Mesvir1/5673/Mv15690-RA.1
MACADSNRSADSKESQPSYVERAIQSAKVLTPILQDLARQILPRSRVIHAAVQAKERELRRPVAALVMFDSFTGLSKGVSVQLVELGSAIQVGMWDPARDKGKGFIINPREHFRLLLTYMARGSEGQSETGNRPRPVPKLTLSFRIRADATDHVRIETSHRQESNTTFRFLDDSVAMIREGEADFARFRECSSARCSIANQSVDLKCAGCGDARYHSRECQRADWRKHKGLCGEMCIMKRHLKEVFGGVAHTLDLSVDGVAERIA